MNITSGAQIARSMGGGRMRRQNQQQDAMEMVFKWSDLYLKANDPAEKAHILNLGRTFIGSLPPELQSSMAKTIEAGPFGGENMKREQFRLHNKRPEVFADPKTQPYMYAKQIFAQQDYDAQENFVATGQKGFTSNLQVIDKDLFASRDKTGTIIIGDKNEFEQRGKAKELDIPFNQFVTGGGWAKIDGSTKKYKNPWGQSQTDQEYININEERQWKPVEVDRRIQETAEDKKLRAFHVNFLAKNSEDPLVASVLDSMEEEKPIEDIIRDVLEPAFPGYHFFPKGKYDDTLGGVDIEKFKLQFIKGVETQGVKDNKIFRFWFSVTPQGKTALYSSTGAKIDNYDEIRSIVNKYNVQVPPDFVGRF